MKLLNLLFTSLFLFQCSNLKKIDSQPLSKEKQVQKYLQRIPASVQDDFKNAKAEIIKKLKVLRKQIKKRKFKLNVLQDKTSNIFQDLKTKLEKIKNEIEEKNSEEIDNDPSLSKILNQVNKLIKSISEEDVYAANTYKKLRTLVDKYIPKYKGFLKRLWDGIVRHKWKIAAGLAGTAVLAGGGYIAYNQYYGTTGQKQTPNKKEKTKKYKISKEEQEQLDKVKRESDVNFRDIFGVTLLQKATKEKYFHVVKSLVKRGADVNNSGESGESPLHIAAGNGDLRLIKYFVEQGANINIKDKNHLTPFSMIVINILLLMDFDDERATSKKIKLGFNILKYLADQGANVSTQDKENGDTPLHHAVSHQSLRMIKFLVEQGADESIKDNDGKTPLDIALKYKNKKIVNFLK